ncbi:uncharacterized protein LOC121655730 isoform X1 [Melanotaenia boesemani]|uniref:uncharacterized protein LOC121655730 isoform X1 n=2 Tax=Melanotaenia boesemani TaxID=1250792 RepID=UPI001C03AD98|nr:uncharacterized protein LOC121655730 isoform X1 [Melanotaenia boesemani]
MTIRTGHDVCGPATFTAGRETSQKSRAKVDEEGLEIAVCRHGILLQGLNHYRGEIYAYPLFLQKELAQAANIKFFCMDLTCRYWPYLEKMAEKLSELQPLTEMRPFLSVMHAKAHTGKCEVRWGGRNQDGAGNTVGEEVEQVNSFLSRAALTTKYMTKSGRADMITMLAMGWNNRKVESLHKTLAKRFVKITQRAEKEAANLQHLQHDLNITLEDTEQWIEDVKQWAATGKHGAHSSQEELQREIDEIIYSLRRKKHDLYRQNVVSLRLKRRLFDQVMLVRRMEEEKPILVKEMTQHYQYLRKTLDKLDNLLHHTEENIKNHTTPTDMTEAGYRGLHCCLLQKKDILQKKLSAVTSTYARVDTDPSVFNMLEEDLEDFEEDYSSSELSDEEMYPPLASIHLDMCGSCSYYMLNMSTCMEHPLGRKPHYI